MFTALIVGLCLPRLAMAFDDSRRRQLAAAVRDAAARSGLTMLRVSQEVERNQAQVTREFACQEGLGRTLASVDAHPREAVFLQWLSVQLATRFGLPREVRLGQRLREARVARRATRQGRAA